MVAVPAEIPDSVIVQVGFVVVTSQLAAAESSTSSSDEVAIIVIGVVID